MINLGTQRAGGLTGKGAYGCIFSPPPQCATGKQLEGDLGKIVLSSQLSEYHKTEKINKIPGIHDYVVIPKSVCIANKKQKDIDWDKCPLTRSDEPIIALGMEFGGITFDKMALDVKTVAKEFKRLLNYALYGLSQIHSAGWLHTDIHGKNLVVDSDGRIRFIDFGMAIDTTNPDANEIDHYIEYNPDLVFLPPEYHIFAMYRNGRNLIDSLLELSRSPQFKEVNRLTGRNINEVLATIHKDPNVKADNNATEFFLRYGQKLDVWSLGMVFFRAYMYMKRVPGVLESMGSDHELIKSTISAMLEFDPNLRVNTTEAMEMLTPPSRFRVTNRNRTMKATADAKKLAADAFVMKNTIDKNPSGLKKMAAPKFAVSSILPSANKVVFPVPVLSLPNNPRTAPQVMVAPRKTLTNYMPKYVPSSPPENVLYAPAPPVENVLYPSYKVPETDDPIIIREPSTGVNAVCEGGMCLPKVKTWPQPKMQPGYVKKTYQPLGPLFRGWEKSVPAAKPAAARGPSAWERLVYGARGRPPPFSKRMGVRRGTQKRSQKTS